MLIKQMYTFSLINISRVYIVFQNVFLTLIIFQINFFIFIRIIKILMSKLRAHQMRYTDYKFR